MILLRLISWPYFRKHVLRTLLTTAGIVLGVAVFVGMRTANQSVLSAFSPLGSLLKSLLSGPAAASGLALYNSIGNLGGFVGPYIVGVLRESTGGYAASMATLAFALVVSTIVVLAVGRAIAAHPVLVVPTVGAG